MSKLMHMPLRHLPEFVNAALALEQDLHQFSQVLAKFTFGIYLEVLQLLGNQAIKVLCGAGFTHR